MLTQPGSSKSFLAICHIFFVMFLAFTSIENAYASNRNPTSNFLPEDKQPSYPGGNEALLKEFAKSINYPEKAKRKYVQLKLFVLLEISAEGKITSSQFLTEETDDNKLSEIVVYGYPDLAKQGKKVNMSDPEKVEFFKEELERVISTLKDFEPATKDGVPVSSKLVVPLVFSLE